MLFKNQKQTTNGKRRFSIDCGHFGLVERHAILSSSPQRTAQYEVGERNWGALSTFYSLLFGHFFFNPTQILLQLFQILGASFFFFPFFS